MQARVTFLYVRVGISYCTDIIASTIMGTAVGAAVGTATVGVCAALLEQLLLRCAGVAALPPKAQTARSCGARSGC